MVKSMIFDESDIKFEELNSAEFEELCFDLLVRLGFHSLIWRQGGADQGRDIEAYFSVTNPLVKTYDEKWFFECKNYTRGVPVDEITSKIAWADAEKPKHFVIITGSYLSNPARSWLEKVTKGKLYETHTIEGKQLKKLLLGFPELITGYFTDKYRKLLSGAKRNWIILDMLPSPETLYLLHRNVNPKRLSTGYIAFLWCLWYFKHRDIVSWCRDNEVEFSFEYIRDYLIDLANSQSPILVEYDDVSPRSLSFGGSDVLDPAFGESYTVLCVHLVLNTSMGFKPGLYCFLVLSEGEGLEVLVEGDDELSTKIRHVKSNAESQARAIYDALNQEIQRSYEPS